MPNSRAARKLLVAGACAVLLTTGVAACGDSGSGGGGGKAVKVGLVTKTDPNPFFVKLRESAQKEADAQGVDLIALAGKFDGDNEGRVAAIENLVARGVQGILITPSGIETVYQDLAVAPALDIATNLFLGRELRRAGPAGRVFRLLDRKRMRTEAARHLADLQIGITSITQPVETISGGQRLGVAPNVFEIADRIHIHRLGRRAAVVRPQERSMSDVVAIMTGALRPDGEGPADDRSPA